MLSRNGQGRAGFASAISLQEQTVVPVLGHGRSLCPSLPVAA